MQIYNLTANVDHGYNAHSQCFSMHSNSDYGIDESFLPHTEPYIKPAPQQEPEPKPTDENLFHSMRRLLDCRHHNSSSYSSFARIEMRW